MIVDASAICEVVFDGAMAEKVLDMMMNNHDRMRIGAINWWEVVVNVNERQKGDFVPALQRLQSEFHFDQIPVGLEVTELAIEARRRYAGRPARLNLGDCFAYALSKVRDEPLLFIGNDFPHTDVVSAL